MDNNIKIQQKRLDEIQRIVLYRLGAFAAFCYCFKNVYFLSRANLIEGFSSLCRFLETVIDSGRNLKLVLSQHFNYSVVFWQTFAARCEMSMHKVNISSLPIPTKQIVTGFFRAFFIGLFFFLIPHNLPFAEISDIYIHKQLILFYVFKLLMTP